MLNFIHIYTVHAKRGYQAEENLPLFVREGFNLWAFLFTLLWAFYHRLWLVSALMLGFNAIVMMLEQREIITSISATVLLLAMQVITGFHGNDWLRSKLKKRGFITTGIVTGDSLIRAEQRYFERHLHA
jgi:hypothetical protein